MVDLAKLVVRLEAENSKLTKALTKSSNDLRRFEGQAKKSFTAVKSAANLAFAGISVGLLSAGLRRTVSSTLEANDRIAKLSQTTGLAVEELNAFDLAANLSGVSLEVFAKGAQRLQRSMFDAAAGLKESKDSFDALGIAVLDNRGNLRSTTDVILELADKFSKIEDGAGKAALAQKLLGRSGADLIPLLNEGKNSLAGYIEEQQRFGNVLTAEVAAASERVNDNFTRLDTVAQGVSRSLTEGMLPALESITTEMLNLSEGSNDAVRELGSFGGDILRTGLSAVLALKAGLDVTGNAIGRFAAALAAVGSGEFRRALDIMTDETGGFVEEYTQAAQSIVRIWDDVSATVEAKAGSNSERLASPVIRAAEKAKKAAKSISQSVKDEMDIALDLLIQEEEALTRQEGKKIAGLAGPTDSQKRGEEIYNSTRTDAEKLNAEIVSLNELLDDGAIDWDTYSRAVFAAQDAFEAVGDTAKTKTDEMTEYARQAARNMQDAFANFLFDPFKDGLSGMLDNFVTVLRQMAAQAEAAQIFGKEGSGGLGDIISSAATSIFGGGKAIGGPVDTSHAYLVGEKGPELFVPKTAGTILPNGTAGAITVNVSMPQSASSQSPTQFGYEIGRAINLATRRNG